MFELGSDTKAYAIRCMASELSSRMVMDGISLAMVNGGRQWKSLAIYALSVNGSEQRVVERTKMQNNCGPVIFVFIVMLFC